MLDKQTLSLNFRGGLETKQNDKLIVPSKLTVLENAVFNEVGNDESGKVFSIEKTPGYRSFTRETFDGDTIEIGSNCASFKNEAIVFDDANYYSYSENQDVWIKKGGYVSALGELGSVRRDERNKVEVSSGRFQDSFDKWYQIYVYQNQNPQAIYSTVIEEESGSIVVPSFEVITDPDARKARVIKDTIFYSASNTVYASTFDPLTRTFGTPIPLAVTSNNQYAALFSPIGLVFAYQTGTTAIHIADSNGVDICTPIPTTRAAIFTLLFNEITNEFLLLFFQNQATQLQGLYIPISGLYSPTDIKNLGGSNEDLVDQISAQFYSNGDAAVFWHHSGTNDGLNVLIGPVRTYYVRIDTDAVPVALYKVFDYNSIIASTVITYNDVAYIGMGQSNNTASAFFLVSEKKETVARFLYTEFTAGLLISEVSKVSDTVFLVAALKTETYEQGDGQYQEAQNRVVSLLINFKSEEKYVNKQIGEHLHFAGGVHKVYDGVTLVENNFIETPRITVINAISGVLGAGSYSYAVIFEWYDNQGILHRSIPSLPKAISLAGPTSGATIRVNTLQFTDKRVDLGRHEVTMALYRTKANGTTYYKVTTPNTQVFNDILQPFVTITDNITTDAMLNSREPLYTSGGILENEAISNLQFFTTTKDRVFGITKEDGFTVYPSKIFSPGECVSFNLNLGKSIIANDGPATGIQAMDDKVVVFTRNQIQAFAGRGPNNAGQDDQYTEFERLPFDVGCVDSKSVVLVPRGIMFRSAKGYYTLTRNLELEYSGSGIDQYKNVAVNSTDILPDQNQVRFLLESGILLVYDTLVTEWAVFTEYAGVDATIYKNGYAFITAEGYFKVDDSTLYTRERSDDPLVLETAQPYILRITTAWIKLNGLQNYQRVYRVGILGDLKSPHLLKVRTYYDYDDSYFEENAFEPSSDTIYQYMAHLRTQKCQAIKIEIFDIDTDGGASFAIQNIGMIAGMKRGFNKNISNTQRG